ncbi:MAG: hypothetical protein HFI13_14970 [Lachnospiraceae bacterium]|jgi:hypothetical protein|nr:hypothetical protein [Lachnospiraceae bacterium]MCI9658047.1 hypothetical protein [Lachnospiraceae bacterium]
MSTDRYISEFDQGNVRRNNCAKIDQYITVRENIRRWYTEFGFDFPHSSENNFRDSWFHYRKLYQERSAAEIIGQAATLDEHLQRAEKDSIIYLFQKISEALEFWYHAALNKEESRRGPDDLESGINSMYVHTANTPNRWVSLVQKKYSEDVFGFATCCTRIANRYILTYAFRIDVQNMIHELKNQVLEIRMGGAHIQRMSSPGDYYRKVKPCFERLVSFCSQYRIKELIIVSELIEWQTSVIEPSI